MNEKLRKFKSCFVTDVEMMPDSVVLVDSNRNRYNVDMNSPAKAQLKKWVETVFLKGVAQTLTVFEYKTLGNDADIENWIVGFCGVKAEEQLNG